jgi:parallel beta-helix repeat protein
MSKEKIRDIALFAGIFLLALAIASRIDTLTGLASFVSGTNSTLSTYSDSDSSSVAQGELVGFFANYSNSSGVGINSSEGGVCTISFVNASLQRNMSFNSYSGVYFFNRTFSLPGAYQYNISCASPLYDILQTSDTVDVGKAHCGSHISGNITLTADVDMENTTDDCSYHGIIINASGVGIDCNGYSIAGTGSGYGVSSDSFSSLNVTGCNITGFSRGVSLLSSDSATVTNSTLSSGSYGIYLRGSTGGVFYYNRFINNSMHVSTDIAGSIFNTTVGGKPIGNDWDDAGNLALFDSDSDGYADFGQQYPYSRANAGKVSANVTDWGPRSSMLDSDNDGSSDSNDCAPLDPAVMAPRNDLLITRNSTLCGGVYYLNDTAYQGIIRFNSSGLSLDCGSARLSGDGSGTGIYINKPNTTLMGCNVSGYYYGILGADSGFLNLTDVVASSNGYAGIALSNSSGGSMSGVTVHDNTNMGLFLTSYSDSNRIRDVSAFDNYVGIYLYYSGGNLLDGVDSYGNDWHGLKLERSDSNDVRGIGYYSNLKGIFVYYSNTNNFTDVSVENNSDTGFYIWFSDGLRLLNVSSKGNSGSGVVLDTARYATIMNSTIGPNTAKGIDSYVSPYAMVLNSTVAGNLDGIYLRESNNNSVIDNNISGNSIGLRVSSFTDASVKSNKFLSNTVEGVLVASSQGIYVENSTFSGNYLGVNISDNSTAYVYNNTIGNSTRDGVWVRDASAFRILNNTLCQNSGFGLFFVNSSLLPSYEGVLGSNSFCSDNSLGMLSFGWYAQLRSVGRNGSNESGVVLNATVLGGSAPQYVLVSGQSGLSSVFIAAEYVISNSGVRVNRTYNMTGIKGDFMGINLTNITGNALNSTGSEVVVRLGIALSPHVYLLSPASGTSTTSHDVTFSCNASHEGGLSNISLHYNLSGGWAVAASSNISGISNSTSFTISLPDSSFGWTCSAFSAYNTSSFAGENFTLNVYTPAPTGGGGGGGGGSDAGGEEATAPSGGDEGTPVGGDEGGDIGAPAGGDEGGDVGAPAAGDAGASAAGGEGSSSESTSDAKSGSAGKSKEITVEDVKTASQVSCDERISVVEEDIPLEDILEIVDVPSGYVVAAKPFKADCRGGENFRMSILVPDSLEDIRLLKCAGKGCSSRTATVTTRICSGNVVEQYRTESFYNVSAAALNLTSVAANLSGGNLSLSSGNYSADFGGSVQASMSLSSENQPEPMNRNVRIVGAPVVVKFSSAYGGSDRVNITVPYVLSEGEDESSVSLYAKRLEGDEARWMYVGGKVDSVRKVVVAEANLSSFAKDGEVTIAPITVVCRECGEAEFVNKFTPSPDSRQAIIMLHGLWGAGKVWDGMVDEFRLTNQPYQLWTFSYLSNKPIEESARDLANYLEANSYRYDRVYVIGYSLGGLVTQQALNYAYSQNRLNSSSYNFISKVGKVLLVAVPNKGSPVANYLSTFISESINSQATDVIPINEDIKDLLANGISIAQVPNITYYAIAGTKPYPFMEKLGLVKLLFGDEENDGLVGLASAQSVGGEMLNSDCINFWSRPIVHTLVIDDRLVQKIMGQIISSETYNELAAKDVKTNLFGYSNYFDLQIDGCSPEDLYIVIGKEKAAGEIERAAYCACGNGICDGIETGKTCAEDCHVEERPLAQRIVEVSLFLLAVLLAVFTVGGFVLIVRDHRRKMKEPPGLPPGFNISESARSAGGSVSYGSPKLEGPGSSGITLFGWLRVPKRKEGELSHIADEVSRINEHIDRIHEVLGREHSVRRSYRPAVRTNPVVLRSAKHRKNVHGKTAHSTRIHHKKK